MGNSRPYLFSASDESDSSARRGAGDDGRVAKPAWAGDPPEPGRERDRLLEAAAACIARDGVLATGVAAVAVQAGVSRPTVYRYFGDRDALLNATFTRAAASFAARHAQHVSSFRHAGDMAIESVLFTLQELGSDPVLGALFSAQFKLDALAVRSFTSRPALRYAARGLEPLQQATGWGDEEMIERTEVLTRSVLSIFVSPQPQRSEEELRGFLQRRILPGLGLEPGDGQRTAP